MSKDGSEDVVVQQPGQEEGPATGMSPSPGIGAVRIRHILERVAPQFVKEYRDLLTEAGFDTLESLTLPYSEFREEVQGMKHRCAVRNTEVRNTRINTRITYYEIWTRSTERTADC